MTDLKKLAEHWRVTVDADGKQILCIESHCLSGIPNVADYAETVRNCAQHLLAFIGEEPATLQQEVETLRRWRECVISALVVSHIYRAEHDSRPE